MRNSLLAKFKIWLLVFMGSTSIYSFAQELDTLFSPHWKEKWMPPFPSYEPDVLTGKAKRKRSPFKFSNTVNKLESSARFQAGPQWEKLRKESEGGIAEDIVNVNGRLFLNYYSELFVSDDEGNTWSVVNGSPKNPLVGYYYSPDKKIIVSGNNILFYNQLSTDGGYTWTEITINTATLPTYYFSTTAITLIGTDLYLATYYNGMYKSSDLGKTWTAINNGFPNQYGYYATSYSIGVFNGQAIAATSFGIYRYDGNTWINSTGTGLPLYTGNGSIPYYLIQSVDVNNSSMIASTNEGVYHSEDLGATWQKFTLPAIERPVMTGQYLDWSSWPPLFYNVEIVDGVIYAIYENYFYTSANGGGTWTNSKLSDRIEVNHVCSIGSSLLLATQDGVYKSNDNGITWQTSNTGFERKYYSSIQSDGKNSFLAPYWGQVLHSTDGKTWTPFDNGLNPHAVGKIFFDDQTAYLNTYKGFYFGGVQQAQANQIFSTDMKAASWSSVSSDFVFNRIYDMAVSGDHLYAIGLKNSGSWHKGIQYSSDKGKSWSTIFSGVTHNNYKPSNYDYEDHVMSVHLSQDTLYAGTFLSGIFKSGDNGATWTALNNGLKLAESNIQDPNAILTIYNIQKKNNVIYFTAEKLDDYATIFYSVNWGKDWQEIDLSKVAPAGAVFLWSSDLILFERQVIVQALFVDENYNVLTSKLFISNHDNNWTQFGPDFPNSYGISLAKVGPFLYAGAASGGVYRIPFVDDETVLFTKSFDDRKDKEISILIKANSFTDILSAQFSLSWDTNVATFLATDQYGLSGIDNNSFGVANVSIGKLTFSWSDSNLQPKTLPDSSTLFAIKFKLTGEPGSSTAIAFQNDLVTTEIIDSHYQEKDYKTLDGIITISPQTTLSGKVRHHLSGLNNAVVNVESNSSPILSINTDASGSYSFDVPAIGTYKLNVKKTNGEYLNYLNEADVARVRRHILQTDPITSPYDRIAADVNQSKSITTLDILHLEAVLLGLEHELPGGVQWKFVPADFAFNVTDPFTYPSEKIIVNAIDDITQDFVGIHLGDVVDSQNSSGRIDEDPFLKISLSDTNEDGELNAVIKGYGLRNISALQIGFEWNASLEYLGLGNGEMNLRTHRMGNNLRLLWDEDYGTQKHFGDGTDLFSVRFKTSGDKTALQNGLKLSTTFNTLSFNESLRGQMMNIEFEEATEFGIGNPYPNPFRDEIKIPVTLDQPEQIQITLLDVTGRKVNHTEVNGEAGTNEIVAQGKELPNGIYFMKILSGTTIRTKKIIKE